MSVRWAIVLGAVSLWAHADDKVCKIGGLHGILAPEWCKSPFVDPTTTTPVVTGRLDPELVQKVASINRGLLLYCYEQQVLALPELKGRVVMNFTISPRGLVSRAEVFESTLGNAAAEECMVVRLRTFVFPRPRGGGSATVRYPFVFELAAVPDAGR